MSDAGRGSTISSLGEDLVEAVTTVEQIDAKSFDGWAPRGGRGDCHRVFSLLGTGLTVEQAARRLDVEVGVVSAVAGSPLGALVFNGK